MGPGMHSAIDTAGPRAHEIAQLMTLFTAVCAVVYLIVIGVLIWALMRKRARPRLASEAERESADRKARVVVGWATALTVLILISLGLSEFFVKRSLSQPPQDPLLITITGHQYWWEIEYDNPDPSQRLRTANELHIPTGKPVQLLLTSNDVIHSFWLPSITGKKDLIPGRPNTEVLIADKPGLYTGQCAEFCGLQHAKMRLVMHADTPEDFEKWRQRQLQPGREPTTDMERRGRAVFTSASCVLCHSVQGTEASATVGPDLTHIGSRSMIAAGTVPNTPSNLSAWILAPHRMKPGVEMPATQLPADDLGALTEYLVSLQ